MLFDVTDSTSAHNSSSSRHNWKDCLWGWLYLNNMVEGVFVEYFMVESEYIPTLLHFIARVDKLVIALYSLHFGDSTIAG